MRKISAALKAHLAQGVTTLCACWKITRRDGAVLCFTDHDRDLSFGNLTFNAGTGMEGASGEVSLGLAAGGSEISGVLTASSMSEEALAEGLYDGARVEVWRVNWADTDQRALLDTCCFGEVRRTGESFVVELRSVAAVFDQETGRIYQASCDADVGDARCGVDMDDPGRSRTAIVSRSDKGLEIRIASELFDDATLTGGMLCVLDGSFASQMREIESCRTQNGETVLRLWRPFAGELSEGTQVRLSVGCDRSFATCRDRFANQDRFRGFPHMPGNDALLAHAKTDSMKMDGGSLFK